MSIRTVKLTIYDDLVCPNCYISYYELGTAIKYAKETLKLPLQFDIEYQPARLICQEALPDGASYQKDDFLGKKFGEEGFSKFKDHVQEWSKDKGENITFDSKISSTTRAFRLSLKAYKLKGKMAQYPLHCALFRAHLVEGKDLSDVGVLSDIAASLNVMSKEEATAFLESDELHEEVNTRCREARANGIKAIPVTIVNDKFRIDGCQCRDVYIRVFQKLATCQGSDCSQAPSPMPAAKPLSNCVATVGA